MPSESSAPGASGGLHCRHFYHITSLFSNTHLQHQHGEDGQHGGGGHPRQAHHDERPHRGPGRQEELLHRRVDVAEICSILFIFSEKRIIFSAHLVPIDL